MSETSIKPRIEKVPLSEQFFQKLPVMLVPILAVAGLIAIGNPASWLTLTVAGLAMGMMIFIMASGLTVVFGLMDVINFGHGAFVAVGAFVGFTVLAWLAGWTASPSVMMNLVAVLIAILAAMLVTGLLGLAFERVIVMPVYGEHLKQILVTMGGLIVAQQMIYVVWGPDELHLSRPEALQGSILIGDAAIEKYRWWRSASASACFWPCATS